MLRGAACACLSSIPGGRNALQTSRLCFCSQSIGLPRTYQALPRHPKPTARATSACCAMQTRIIVQPGNEGLCLPGPGTIRVDRQRGPHVPGGFNRQICSAGKGQATYCSTRPAELPVCEEATAGQRPRLAGRKGGDRDTGSAVAGGLAAAAGGVLAVTAAAAAVGLRQRQRRRQQRAAQLPSALWDGELANLLPHSGAQLQHRDSAAAAPAGSKPPSSGGSSGMAAAGEGSSEDASGERRGLRSSWRLHSRSLQLQADDFQILLDKSGRPDLLGAGASAKVRHRQPMACRWPSVVPLLL